MSELEKFIKQEIERFDDVELPSGHENRLLLKLEKEHAEKDNRARFWRVAAAIIVLLVAGGSLLLPRFNSPADVHYGSMSLSEVSADMANIELYYTSQLERKYVELEEMVESNLSVRSLFNELATLNDSYEQLEKELYKSGSNDRVVLAMIENFRLRLALIEKLENINNKKQTDD